ncbi:hypothetical protein LTSEADE_1334, partial [Salmonella enterica subsp. enterica serovar Adelaide str. A4-669]
MQNVSVYASIFPFSLANNLPKIAIILIGVLKIS